MSKKKLITILSLIIITILIVFGIYFYCNQKLEITSIYIAKYTLPNRTLIEENQLSEIKVPKVFLSDEMLYQKEDIVGKYVKINTQIPKGSYFYKDSLQEYSEIKDKLSLDLSEKELCFDIDVSDIKVNEASIVKGMYVDIYITINKDRIVSDLLVNNVKIIGLYDVNNNEIKDYDTYSKLKTISLAVPEDSINYLNKGRVVGTLSIVIGANAYINEDSFLNINSDIFNYLI